MKNIILILLTLTLLSSCSLFSQTNDNSTIEDYKREIIGTWINQDEPFNKWIFTKNNICYLFKNLGDSLEFKYFISKKPLFCKKYNPIFDIKSYMFLFKNKKEKDTLCYELLFNKLDMNELGIRYLPMEKGVYGVFRRQKQ